MKITKFEHSGLAIEKDGKVLVFDPVEFTEKIPALLGVVGIVITHKHGDHLQPAVIERILSANPEAELICSEETLASLPNASVARAGDVREVGDFKLEFFGKNHAEIIPGQIPCDNIGVVIDGIVVNPGDSFDLPNGPVRVLLTPIAAPFSL